MATGEPRVPDAVAPPPRHPRFPLADGVRAVAVLCVVAVHAVTTVGADGSVPGRLALHLNVGVTIFFLLSGFLLYRPFVAARMEAKAGPRTLAYARRRFLRIVPAYWLALSILIVYPGVGGLWSDAWPVYYGFGQVYSQDTILGGIGPAWTLCTEVVFYAFLPLYAFVLARWLGGRRDAIPSAGCGPGP